jgi:hypothetical protein
MSLTTNASAGCTKPMAKKMSEVIIPQISRPLLIDCSFRDGHHYDTALLPTPS